MMEKDLSKLVSDKAKALKTSEIGELLAMAKVPDMISFAVGMPDPQVFPKEDLSVVGKKIFGVYGNDVLQYGDISGHASLRDKVSPLVEKNYGFKCGAEQIILTTGSMQGLDLCSRLLLNKDDVVLVEEPTFVDAIATFEFAGAKVKGVPCDSEGIVLNKLEQLLAQETVKAIYVIPDFQNPTGLCWSEERRKAFMELVAKYNVAVLEDNPYGEIKYNQGKNTALKALDKKGQVIFLGSLSKTLSPGLRIGWICADKSLIEVLKFVKERCDCHSSLPDHMLAAEYMNMFSYQDHIQDIIDLYKKRLLILTEALAKYLPDCKYDMPQGGFFLWLELPEGINCMELFDIALKDKVCFVPGTPFYPERNDFSHLRLNFTFIPEDKIEEGIKRLAKAVNKLKAQ